MNFTFINISKRKVFGVVWQSTLFNNDYKETLSMKSLYLSTFNPMKQSSGIHCKILFVETQKLDTMVDKLCRDAQHLSMSIVVLGHIRRTTTKKEKRVAKKTKKIPRIT